MTKDIILKQHKYAIWQSKDGKYWYTTLPDETKRRNTRQIRRQSEQELYDAICDWYGYKETLGKQETQKLYSEKLEKERLKESFAEYKEIKVWDVKPNSYLISPIGNIYSMLTKQWIKPQLVDGKDSYLGQLYVTLYTKEGEMRRYSVARLVMATYNGLPPKDMEDPTVDHIDHIPLNNYYKNLRWLERGINSASRPNRGIGEMNSRAKLTQDDVIKICNALCKKTATVSELAKQYDVSPRTIRSIREKKNWSYISQWFDFE